MATQSSFDISTGTDLQEVDNAVNQARKEVAQRYDFKGSHCRLELDKQKALIDLEADDDFRMKALWDVLQTALVRRKVPLKNVHLGDLKPAAGGHVKQQITLQQSLPTETAKAITKDIKAQGLKKVQVAIQGDQVRVSSPSRDALQDVIAFLRSKDYGVELRFGNYRS